MDDTYTVCPGCGYESLDPTHCGNCGEAIPTAGEPERPDEWDRAAVEGMRRQLAILAAENKRLQDRLASIETARAKLRRRAAGS